MRLMLIRPEQTAQLCRAATPRYCGLVSRESHGRQSAHAAHFMTEVGGITLSADGPAASSFIGVAVHTAVPLNEDYSTFVSTVHD